MNNLVNRVSILVFSGSSSDSDSSEITSCSKDYVFRMNVCDWFLGFDLLRCDNLERAEVFDFEE